MTLYDNWIPLSQCVTRLTYVMTLSPVFSCLSACDRIMAVGYCLLTLLGLDDSPPSIHPTPARLCSWPAPFQPTNFLRKSTALQSATAICPVPFHLLSSIYHPTPTTTIRPISTTPPKTPPSPSVSTKAPTPILPHLTPSSEVHLISTSPKPFTYRIAVAIGHVRFSNPEPLRSIRQGAIKKGDVLAVARIAAIQAVKKTGDLIPLAHNGVPVEGCVVRVEPVDASPDVFTYNESPALSSSEVPKVDETLQLSQPIGMYGGVRISVQVETTAKTGVEMEALTGVVGAALTVLDMCKGVDKGCVIDGVRVAGKKGGRSGGLGIWREKPGELLKELDGGLEDKR